LPAWQCGGSTPGDGDGFRIFGLLAAEQGLRINSYYAGRYRQDSLAFHCSTEIQQIAKQKLAADTAYVVSAQIAEEIASGPSGGDQCYSVDGFILCSTHELVGLAHWQVPDVKVGGGGLTAQDAGYFISGWDLPLGPFGTWSVTSDAVVAYRAVAKPAKSVRFRLMVVGGKNPVSFSVIGDNARVDGTVPATNPARIQLFTVRMPIGTGPAIHKVRIITRQLRSPQEQGLNSDFRPLGVGVRSFAADACPPSSVVDFHATDAPDPACLVK
jgi:hypothetical protein